MKNLANLRTRVKPYLEDLKTRATTNRAVAEALGVNEQSLSRVLGELGFERDPPVDREAHRQLVKTRKEYLAHCAATMTPEEAARACDVSVRTIYRYLDKIKKAADGA